MEEDGFELPSGIYDVLFVCDFWKFDWKFEGGVFRKFDYWGEGLSLVAKEGWYELKVISYYKCNKNKLYTLRNSHLNQLSNKFVISNFYLTKNINQNFIQSNNTLKN